MTAIEIKRLPLDGVCVLRFRRYVDERGYFVETFRLSKFRSGGLEAIFGGTVFVQANESFSRAGTIRGMHFQWEPPMGKLVRTLHGHMVDLVMDVRLGSPTLGRIVAYDMPEDREYLEWIWIPPGFAHGNFFLADTRIEYLCTAEYSAAGESGISPLAADIDWGLCDKGLRSEFERVAKATQLITDKDRNGMPVRAWLEDARSRNFVYADGR
jgi:dTDP-4-dehydrorhamnose 3,5-epimerase